MKKDLIQKEYKKKIKSLTYYNQKYYNDNISEISDSEYDNLKNDILSLEKKFSYLICWINRALCIRMPNPHLKVYLLWLELQ